MVKNTLKIPGINGVKISPQLVTCILNLHVLFQDEKKVALWLNTKNPNFGNIRPITLFARGHGQKILRFIENAIEGARL